MILPARALELAASLGRTLDGLGLSKDAPVVRAEKTEPSIISDGHTAPCPPACYLRGVEMYRWFRTGEADYAIASAMGFTVRSVRRGRTIRNEKGQ